MTDDQMRAATLTLFDQMRDEFRSLSDVRLREAHEHWALRARGASSYPTAADRFVAMIDGELARRRAASCPV